METSMFTLVAVLATFYGCRGQGPIYANLRKEMDSFSSRMSKSFDRFKSVFEKFDSKLDSINGTITTDVVSLNERIEGLGSKLKAELNRSHEQVREMGEHTSVQLSNLEMEMHTMQRDSTKVKTQMEKGQGDTTQILRSIDGIKKDFKDFKLKTTSMCNVLGAQSNISHMLENNRKTFSSDISTMRRKITSVIQDELLSIQTAIASLLNDMSAIKKRVKNIGFATECPSSWSRFENSCYLPVAEKMSWKLAKFMCSQMDSFLVEIYSGKEIDFLASLTGNKTSELWTGANIGKKGVWYWSESRSEVALDIFKGDYPSGRSRKYCGTLSIKTQSIENMNCGKEYTFVCRKFSLVSEG